MVGRLRRIAYLLLLSAEISAGLGCTPIVSRLQPYRDDPVKARELERRANALCCRRRGPTDMPPHPFTTDGCSLWPDDGWVSCCVDHDIAYWCGGSCEDRAQADQTLRRCVAEHGPAGMGTTMYVGVRVGGLPWYPVPFRWGYGFDWPHGYDHRHADATGCPPAWPSLSPTQGGVRVSRGVARQAP
jgi:hypothetical protein